MEAHYRLLSSASDAEYGGWAGCVSARADGLVVYVISDRSDPDQPGEDMGEPSSWHAATRKSVFEAEYEAESGVVRCKMNALPEGVEPLTTNLAPCHFS